MSPSQDSENLAAQRNARAEAERQMRIMSDATQDMIWTWDAATDHVFHNAAFAAVLGSVPGPANETVAWWKARVHPEDAQRVLNAFHKAAAEGWSHLSYEYRFQKPDESWLIIDDRACLIRDDSGKVVKVLGSMRDITLRREAERAQARFASILEATTDVVGMARPDGQLLYLNDAGRRLFRFGLSESLDSHRLREIHPPWAGAIVFEEAIPTAIEQGAWSGETALLNGDGKEIPVLQVILSHPGSDGKVEFISTIIRDISERKREEIARIEEANRYDAAIRASGQLLFDWHSSTGEISYAGDIERFLGFSMNEMAGGLKRFRELIHPEDLEAFDNEIHRVTETRDPFHLKVRLLRKDTKEIVIDAKGYFFLDRKGAFGRMVGFLADITETTRAQQELAGAHDTLEGRVAQRTAELANANRVIRGHAAQQEAVAHLGQRALAGADLPVLFEEATALVRDTLGVDVCTVLELSEDRTSLVVRGRAGWPRSLPIHPVPMGKKSQSGYTLLAREPVIVEEMEKETRFEASENIRLLQTRSSISVAIHAGNEPIGVLLALSKKSRVFTKDDVHFLQSCSNVLTAAIDRARAEQIVRLAREQAETANRAKSEFLSRMSHELRTPLNAILGFTQLLEMDSPTMTQQESIIHIVRGGNHLLALINEVLDIARLDSGRFLLSPEPVEIEPLLRDVVDLLRPLADKQSIQIHLKCDNYPTTVIADRQRLKQVFLNLVSNAVKYNRPSGSVSIVCLAGEPGQARIRFTDSGYGIPEEKFGLLFVPFERLGAEATDIEGTGIGLTLSQRIIHALDGQLTFESELGVGSTFEVQLPVATEEEIAQNPPLDSEFPPELTSVVPHARTILYIEDQDLNLRLVERIIQRRPELKLLSAMQGGLALELAREHRPDLILLDLNLPDMPGDEVLNRLKADPELGKIPVIMVSADAMGDRIEHMLQLGAQGYLTKPYKVQAFLKTIDEVLGS